MKDVMAIVDINGKRAELAQGYLRYDEEANALVIGETANPKIEECSTVVIHFKERKTTGGING